MMLLKADSALNYSIRFWSNVCLLGISSFSNFLVKSRGWRFTKSKCSKTNNGYFIIWINLIVIRWIGDWEWLQLKVSFRWIRAKKFTITTASPIHCRNCSESSFNIYIYKYDYKNITFGYTVTDQHIIWNPKCWI
jgi:hypothetical protein